MKCAGSYADYFHTWPQAKFINVLRDGRDVLASQMRMKSFNKSPSEVGKAWAQTHRRFEKLAREIPGRTHFIRYEGLARTPEIELRKLCTFLELPFDANMIKHHMMDLTVFQAQHISGDRVRSPIDTSKIDRWRRDLNDAELEGFLSTARDELLHFGYEI